MSIRTLLLTICLVAPAVGFADDSKMSDTTLLNSSTSNIGRALEQEDHSYLLRHNPFYFAYGVPYSKLQLSFRTKLIRDFPLYFAYTQVMFWELRQDSKPFRDMTFNPELFYRQKIDGLLKSIDVGYAHDSNGKDGDSTRSYNTAYARFNFEKEFHKWLFQFALTGQYLHDFDDTNRNIGRYIGPLSLKASWIQLYDAWIDKGEFALQATPGGNFAQDWQNGGYQVSYSFRFGKMHLVPSFYLQYYFGHAESLLNYNQYIKAFRAGVIF